MNKQIFYRNSKNKNYILRNIKPGKLCTILDVETTGLNDIAEIIQFSAIQIEINNDYSFSEIDRMNVYIKPNTPVPKKITEITGITNDMLINEKTETEVFSSIRDFIKGSIIVGHNIQFDYSKIQEMFKRNGMLFIAPAIIDTLEMSRDINPKRSHKLSDLAHDYGIDAGLTFHNSMDDVIATRRLFEILLKTYIEMPEWNGTIKPKIGMINYYAMPNHKENRIYVNTNYGTFYYNVYYKCWGAKSDTDMTVIDMDYIEDNTLKLLNMDIKDFSKFKGKYQIGGAYANN